MLVLTVWMKYLTFFSQQCYQNITTKDFMRPWWPNAQRNKFLEHSGNISSTCDIEYRGIANLRSSLSRRDCSQISIISFDFSTLTNTWSKDRRFIFSVAIIMFVSRGTMREAVISRIREHPGLNFPQVNRVGSAGVLSPANPIRKSRPT